MAFVHVPALGAGAAHGRGRATTATATDGVVMDIRETLVRTGDYVLVADGQKALLLRNDGNVDAVRLTATRILESGARAPTHAMGRDRPGHFLKDRPSRRGSFEASDLHTAAERSFARLVAEEFGDIVAGDERARVLLLAPAKTLGELRTHLRAGLADRISGEFAREMTNAPIADIEALLNK